jgi:hypothetical protein
MAELHNTLMGKKLIKHTLPEIARQLERIADALESKQQKPDQVISAFRSYLNSGENDQDIIKKLRELWKTN